MMNVFVIFGLGFGDESKGNVTDAFARRYVDDCTVVRYNGGPQAGHNTISPDGVWHCFAQFGAGACSGARSCISSFMPVKLEMFLGEAEILESKGVAQPFDRLTIDPRCNVITPGHVLVGRLREIMRGNNRFGSCGLGVGETILNAERGLAISINDLLDVNGEEKLRHVFAVKLDEASDMPGVYEHPIAKEQMDELRVRMDVSYLYAEYRRIIERLSIQPPDLSARTVIFEGAQGALLDRAGGFAPYVTKSRATWHNAEQMLSGSNRRVTKIGILRAYGHRHGAGPFVTEDAQLRRFFDDPRNTQNQWQGAFRVGCLDLVALRYGLKLNDGADMLALTHLDRLSGIGSFRVCTSYLYEGDPQALGDRFVWEYQHGRVVITEIRSSSFLAGLPSVAEILFRCMPHTWKTFEGWTAFSDRQACLEDFPEEAQTFIRWLESPDGLHTPIGIVSTGPRSDQVLFLFD